MKIKVVNPDELMERHAIISNTKYFQLDYEVIAIRKTGHRWQYLVDFNQCLEWWDKDLFEVTDDALPKDWVIIQFGRFHKFKNKKYDFNIPTSYYQGPKEFIENEDFFFNIIENPAIAYAFYFQYKNRENRESEIIN